MKPARQVVTRSPHRTVGLINAGWIQSIPIEYESQLERRFIHLALLMPELISIRHQPFKIEYHDGERTRVYVPDMLLFLEGGRHAVIEIKPARFVEKHRAKFDAVSNVLAKQNSTYFVVTEEHILEDRWARAEYWLHFARAKLSDSICLPVMKAVSDAGNGVEYRELLKLGFSESVILYLLGRRYFVAGADLITAPETKLYVVKRGSVENEAISINRWFGCSPWRA